MSTHVQNASRGIITDEMRILAKSERISAEKICRRVASGRIVLMTRNGRVTGIGKGLKTKVNVNIGTSGNRINISDEIEKATIAENYGADTLSELSMGGDITAIRRAVLEKTTLPLTTVPIYQTVSEKGIPSMDDDDIIRDIESQIKEGISSIVLHTINQSQIRKIQREKRIMGVVSKGGSIMASYMTHHERKNPHLEYFEQILDLMSENDQVLSLGNAVRSGCIHDHRDRAQEKELCQNIRLAKRAHEKGIQTIIEFSGGHVRADRIRDNVTYYKKRSPFPLFIAGPLPIDTAVGHDHIAAAVGAGIASGSGTDYLCYITPSEHLGLPSPQQVKEGLVAFKIAAHIGDTMKYGPARQDKKLAKSRRALDWDGQFRQAIDPEGARQLRGNTGPCTMCGDYCAIRLMEGIIPPERKR